MGKNSNKKKAEFLGVPYGTACNRLRKQILFEMVQRAGEDVCYRCGRIIETVDEFSIEHMKSWLGVDASLFWDLNNIAFSHLSCNSGAKRIPHKIVPPEGKGWCKACKKFLPLDRFPKQTDRFKSKALKLCSSCQHKQNMS